ncbi:MAG: hypothetical protein JJ958_08685 [Balneola sp.]|nr:hypothetical protein [Balneola sp.]
MRILFSLILFKIMLCFSLKAQYGYFYTGKNYGSEARTSTLNTLLNGGFDVVQASSISNKFSEMGLKDGFNNVTYSLLHPFKSINEVGWGAFLRSEVLPTGFDEDNDNWMPNYLLHTLGGGTVYATLSDYYTLKGYKRSRFFAGFTVMSYHFLNEVVEKNYKGLLSFDAVADIYIFDPLGILLFSNKSVQHFFSHEIIIRDWSSQVSLRFLDFSIRNSGQNFSFKWKPYFKNQPLSLFGYFGMGGLAGLGYDYKNHTISVGAGFKTKDIVYSRNNDKIETIEVSPALGFFIDKNNSLMISVLFNSDGNQAENFKLEIFPGVIPLKNLNLGFWLSNSYSGQVFYGITLGAFPGISF